MHYKNLPEVDHTGIYFIYVFLTALALKFQQFSNLCSNTHIANNEIKTI